MGEMGEIFQNQNGIKKMNFFKLYTPFVSLGYILDSFIFCFQIIECRPSRIYHPRHRLAVPLRLLLIRVIISPTFPASFRIFPLKMLRKSGNRMSIMTRLLSPMAASMWNVAVLVGFPSEIRHSPILIRSWFLRSKPCRPLRRKFNRWLI